MDLIKVLWFLLGLSLGSFSLVVIMRYPKGGIKASFMGKSNCENCQHKLGLLDLIPLLSYIMHRGKCRWCKIKLSYIYPLWELLLAILATGLSFYFPNTLIGLINLIIITVLLILAGIDWLTMEIDEKLIGGGLWLILLEILIARSLILPHIYGLIIGAGFFFILVVIGKGKWMGGGDILVGGLVGFWLGYPLISTVLLLSFILGAIYGGLLLATKKATLKTAVPFAPFIIISSILTLLYGANMLKWISGGN